MPTRLQARCHRQPWIGVRWSAGVPAGQDEGRHQQQLLLPRVLPDRQLAVHSVSVGRLKWRLRRRLLLREQGLKISGLTRFSAARPAACHVGTRRSSRLCENSRIRKLRAIEVVAPSSETRMLLGNSIVVVLVAAGLQEMRHFRLAASMAAALSTLATRFRFVDCTPGLSAAAPVMNIVALMATEPGGARLSWSIDVELGATQRTTCSCSTRWIEFADVGRGSHARSSAREIKVRSDGVSNCL